MNEFERIINDSMMESDYIPGYDDGEWDTTMGDDEWLDDCQGEEEFA
jgi:hypothetical protein